MQCYFCYCISILNSVFAGSKNNRRGADPCYLCMFRINVTDETKGTNVKLVACFVIEKI